MDAQEINFENLPKAVAHLVNEIAEIKSIVEKDKFRQFLPRKFLLTFPKRVN